MLGPKWKKIAEIVGTRNRKQCRDRYVNHHANINAGPWENKDYQNLICGIEEFYHQYGMWVKIQSKYLPDRSPNDIKNKGNAFLKQQGRIFIQKKQYLIAPKPALYFHVQNCSCAACRTVNRDNDPQF